jgi:ATP-dependent Clp protease ATP-binding subunit ClpA
MIFNRFARGARACVEAAVEEARTLGHDSVGDEDLLLGILRADGGVAADALSSLGVNLKAAREESEKMTAEALAYVGISLEDIRREAGDNLDMRIPEGRRIPFSPAAKKALEGALAAAMRLRDNRIGAEHVLLGILNNADGTAVRMLARMGVPSVVLQERLSELRGRAAG